MLDAVHREILETLLNLDAPAGELRRAQRTGREFDDLRHRGLITFWAEGSPRPLGIAAGQQPGRWYVSSLGEVVLGRETTALRLAPAR